MFGAQKTTTWFGVPSTAIDVAEGGAGTVESSSGASVEKVPLVDVSDSRPCREAMILKKYC
ncbi:MAG: hypothetical protein BWY66_01407 [bacterium ADurb.Bin374]|nr:MAG: hypothetical protein BWY66_01407 [bacterium ADurb.Bin374]